MKFYDKNGRLIEEGDTIRHDNGDVETIIKATVLGVNASKRSTGSETYPLTEFNLKEWEVIKEES